jgi:hypothetical protein
MMACAHKTGGKYSQIIKGFIEYRKCKMKQLSYVRSLFAPKYKSLEGSTGQMEGTSYREQTVTISGRGLAWNIKPFA